MPSQKSIPISELITTANSELLRLDFKRSALQIYCAEFRKFSDYYSNEKIQDYTATTGREYFQSIYGVNIASPRLQLTKSQSATRRAIRLLDDIFQFGYALRYCHRSYTVNPEYDILLESYLMKCRKKHNSQGTLRTKQMKLCQFFEYIEGRNIQLACLTYTIFPKGFRPLLPQNTLHPMHYAVCWLPPTLQRQRDADTLFFLRFYTTRQHV